MSEFKFKDTNLIGPVDSSDWYYDLFQGYINPEDFLEEEDAIDLRKAIDRLQLFIDILERRGLLRGI